MKNYKSKRIAVSSRDKRLKEAAKEKCDSSRRGNISLGALSFCVVLGLVFSGAFYLSQVNGIAIKGFDIRDAEKKIKALEKQNERLRIQEAELASMSNIENSMADLNLISPANISYIEINSPVAMR